MTHEQLLDEDAAADMRDRGYTWASISSELGVSMATARRYAAASDRRVQDRASREQIALF